MHKNLIYYQIIYIRIFKKQIGSYFCFFQSYYNCEVFYSVFIPVCLVFFKKNKTFLDSHQRIKGILPSFCQLL